MQGGIIGGAVIGAAREQVALGNIKLRLGLSLIFQEEPMQHAQHFPKVLERTFEENFGADHLPADDVDAALHEIAMKNGLRDFLHGCEVRLHDSNATGGTSSH
jgi:hypothetical protein